jgi:hypothetical protein
VIEVWRLVCGREGVVYGLRVGEEEAGGSGDVGFRVGALIWVDSVGGS